MHTQRMNSISLLLVRLGSCVLLLSSGALAIGVSPINNIDIYQSILRESPAKGENSNLPDDMFGWAAIMHQTEVVNSGDNMNEAARKTRIIVGAPYGTYPGGLNLPDPGKPRAEQSGLVYNCPVQPGTCEGIRGNTTRYLNDNDTIDNNAGLIPALRLQDYPQSYIEGRLFDQAPNAILFFLGDEIFIPAENKTGQLLGATLFSNGETFMACAPRWTDTRRSAFSALPRGVCYTSGRNLQDFRRLQLCDGDSPSASNTINDGYCLAGTSALVYNGASFVIGAPGNQEGRGSLFYSANPVFMSGRSILPNDTTGMNESSIRDQYQGLSTVSAFTTVQRGSGNPPNGGTPNAANMDSDGSCLAGTSASVYNRVSFVISAPGNQEGQGSVYSARINNPMFTSGRSILPNAAGMDDISIRDQYQGFSSVSAFITVQRGSGNPNVVTAVPRYDDDSYAGRILVYNPDDYQTILAVDARGTQMAEFFGHSMIAVDINGDNYDELVIGAPMNTDFDARMIKVERGRVYVFMNTGGNLASEPIIFNGTNPRGRLGTSLANLGDIDRDGFEDFAVGAPYTINSPTSNTGVVYIYYGNRDLTAFTTQAPFEISASDVVDSLTSLSELKTFGFSVSGGVDVDNNQFNDLLVGAYESQLVVLFRSRPVVTVVVEMRVVGPTPVALNSIFSVSVTARYEGMGVNTLINVPFNLSEDRSVTGETRLSFDGNGAGIFTLMGPGVRDTQTIRVTSLENTTDSHMLLVTIPGGLPPPMAPTDGNQPLIDLSTFPRLRLGGKNALSVSVTDPCVSDGIDGCQFDVRLSPQQNTIQVIANDNPIHTMDLMYENIGREDAVGLRLNFSSLPEYIRSVSIGREDASPAETLCSVVSNNAASCMLRTQLIPRARDNVMVNFTVDQERLTGAEPNMTADLAIDSMTGRSGDGDVDSSNNGVQVTFDVVARAQISVSLSFGGRRFDYTAVDPGPSATVQDLGRSTIILEVDILNSGPTTIRKGMVTIYLANRVADTKFTLYPTRLDADNNVANGEIGCDESFLPYELPLGDSQIGQVRRRRSASQRSSSSLKRVTRQEDTVHTCVPPKIDSGVCTRIVCNVTNLRRGTVPFTISVFTRIDERYFAQQPDPGTVYQLTTSANVSIDSSFYGDDLNDNTGTVTIELGPMEEGIPPNTLLHVILWPGIGGLLLLVLAAVVLYFLGFFSRKKKPVEGEIEGNFDVDQFKLKPNSEDTTKEPSAPLAAGGGPDAPSEITKV